MLRAGAPVRARLHVGAMVRHAHAERSEAIAEAALRGAAPAPDVLGGAVSAEQAGLHPAGDLHAPADYRRHPAGVLLLRAIEQAVSNATTSRPQAA